MLLPVGRRLAQQPQGPVRAAPGWARVYVGHAAATRDLVNSATSLSPGNRTYGAGLAGVGISVTAGSQVTTGEVVPGISTGITAVFIAEKLGNVVGGSDFLWGEHQTGTGAYNWGFYESAGNPTLVSFYVHNGSGVAAANSSAGLWAAGLGPQVWVATYGDGDNVIRLYLNGVQVGTAAQTGSIQRNATALLRAAFWNGAAPNYRLYGSAVAARRLSAAEVARGFSSVGAAWNALVLPAQNYISLPGGDAFSKGVDESFTVSDVSGPASMSFTPIVSTPRRLLQPAGRRVTAPWYGGNENRTWSYNGTLANVSRQYHAAEGRCFTFLSSVSMVHVMADPIGANNTLNLTVFARLRIDSFSSNPLFSFGSTANNLQHYLQCNAAASSLYFTAAGWNGSTNTSASSGETPALTAGRFYNIAITVRYQLIEIWLDGVKVVSTANTLQFAANTMTHAVLHGIMSGGSPAASSIAVTYAALVAYPEQVLSDAEIRSVTSNPRGIHRLFELRRPPLLLTAGGATLNSAGAESVTLTHDQAGAHTMLSANADSFTLADSQTGPHSAQGDSAESLTVTDSQTGPFAAAGAGAESLTVTDSSTNSGTGEAAAAESVTLTHTQSNTIGYGAAAAESLTFSDTMGVVLAAIGALSETLTLSDAGSASTPGQAAADESVTIADSQTGLAALRVVASESITLAEAASALSAQLRAAAESFTPAEGATGDITVAYAKSLAEALTLAEVGTKVLVAISNGTTETVYVLAELTTMTVELEEADMVVPPDGNDVSPPTLN